MDPFGLRGWAARLLVLAASLVASVLLAGLAARALRERRASLSDPEALATAARVAGAGTGVAATLRGGGPPIEPRLLEAERLLASNGPAAGDGLATGAGTTAAVARLRRSFEALATHARETAALGAHDRFQMLCLRADEAVHAILARRGEDPAAARTLGELDAELLDASLGRANATRATLLSRLEAALPTPARSPEEEAARGVLAELASGVELEGRRLAGVAQVARDRDEVVAAADAYAAARADEAADRLARLDLVLLGSAAGGLLAAAASGGLALREWRRRGVEQRLAHQSLALEQLTEAVVLSDPTGVVLYVNPAFEVMTGYAAGEILGRRPNVLKSGVHDAAFYEQLWGTILGGRPWAGRMVNRRKDGALYEILQSISPLRRLDGSVVGFAAVGRDVTGEQQADRLKALGTLVAEIAHEINGPANALALGGSLVEDALDDVERHLRSHGATERDEILGQPWRQGVAEVRQIVSDLLTAARRIGQFVKDLRGFASPDDVKPVPFSPAEAVVSGLRLLQHELRTKGVAVELDLGTVESKRVLGRPRRFEQLAVNLLSNAARALEKAGGRARVKGSLEGETVVLVFEDDGPGVPAELVTKLFQPFVTGNRESGGTGLGLALCARIAQEMNGTIALDPPRAGVGASFRVRLPAVPASAPAV